MTQVIKYFALGTPINRLPIMAKQVLDLYELYNLVTARGGLVEVINKKQWQEIIKGLNLPSSITSAAFTLRTQWVSYIYHKKEEIRKTGPYFLTLFYMGSRRYVGTREGGGVIEPPLAKSFQRQPISIVKIFNAKFWSLAVHRYQKHPPLMANFTNRGQGIKLVIYVAKKKC